MAPNKPKTRTWYDVQMAIAAIAMSITLALWNLFAGPDRAQAAQNTADEALVIPPPIPTETPVVSPTPMPIVKIIFGSPGSSSSSQQTSGQPDVKKKRDDVGGGVAAAGGKSKGGGGKAKKGGGGGGGSTKSS